MTGDRVLEVDRLTTRFRVGRGWLTAVDDVSFHVDPGETLGLVGESGSGKSVTAMSIMRLVAPPGEVSAGHIRLNGLELSAQSSERLRKLRGSKFGMVFQNPMSALNPVFTVGWQMEEALRAHGRRRDATSKIERALTEVGMPDARRQAMSYPHQMSGGMRQRVVIAMGMLNAPDLLIADEPTTALDVTIQAQVLELMRRLTRDKGSALLLITHNMGVIARMCDRVAVMYAGEIVEEAPVDALFSDALHPYTRGLLRSVPDGTKPLRKVPTLPGEPPDMNRPIDGCRFRPRCAFADARCTRHPALEEIRSRHKSRCWITQAGEPIDATRENDAACA